MIGEPISTTVEAKKVMISLGRAGKMPCPTYNTPASLCVTGSKLRDIEGTTCEGCYAMKGNYLFPNVQEGLTKRFHAFLHPRFVEAMTFMIKRYSAKSGYFRWFDSGDLKDIAMLEKIAMICQQTPEIEHWLPTREVKVVSDYLKIYKEFPDNLMVRVSAPMIDGLPIKSYKYTSTVNHKTKPIGHDCPARFQDNECRDCRACWDREVTNVSYHKH
jgi:hypothetical protein